MKHNKLLAVPFAFILGATLCSLGGGDGTKGGENRPSGPSLGGVAPDFKLPKLDVKEAKVGQKEIHLADFIGKSPVVLVFGSYT